MPTLAQNAAATGAPVAAQSFKQRLNAALGKKRVKDIYAHDPVVKKHSSSGPRPAWYEGSVRVNDSLALKAVLNSCLVFALFGGGFWQVVNVPDDPGNAILDVCMVVVTIFFILEMVITWAADPDYRCSFFFGMDFLGTASMIFEISFLLGPAGKPYTNDAGVEPLVMRTARVAKMAARAGRFLKLAKCLDRLVSQGLRRKRAPEQPQELAEILSAKMTRSVSTKVSLLALLLVAVIIVPIFSLGEYPTEDLSLKVWVDWVEKEYSDAYTSLESEPNRTTTSAFSSVVTELRAFYSEVYYSPYMIEGYEEVLDIGDRMVTIPGASQLHAEAAPIRVQNVVVVEVDRCQVQRPSCSGATKAAIYFNFEQPKRIEAISEILTCLFVIIVMCLVSAIISMIMDRMVVRRLSRMLASSKKMALVVLNLNESKDEAAGRASQTLPGMLQSSNFELSDELTLLEEAFRKLSLITHIECQQNVADEEAVQNMAREEKGIVVDMMGARVAKARKPGDFKSVQGRVSITSLEVGAEVSERLGFDPECWQCNWLEMTEAKRERGVMYLFFSSLLSPTMEHGSWLQKDKMRNFYQEVMKGYNDLPYHNRMHALDVAHTVYRYLVISGIGEWAASGVEQTALLIAALGHDLGHEGRTNPFLVEKRDPLALTYNDASPLENLHCANLFRIAKETNTNIFEGLPIADFKAARKVCIKAILHTDNAHHFAMVKDLQTLYEFNTNACEAQASEPFGNGAYMRDVLEGNSEKLQILLLHLADVSNPAKPEDICVAWADRALEEFFAQGDEEKALGMPVGMLNDRDKVNRPSSQHGFIKFLVAPLMVVSVKVLPPLHPLLSQLRKNMAHWRDVWVQDTPQLEPALLAQRDEDIADLAMEAERLAARAWSVANRLSSASVKGLGTVSETPEPQWS